MSAGAWKELGITYLQYLELCSKTLRGCLKPELMAAAIRRGESILKFSKWESGKQGELKIVPNITSEVARKNAASGSTDN
ncbi:hypothetical protein DI09_106p80 [Mitosporidium daphniae]|uniref:Uncharacterized protein n=1 Tax=Mitosporidium daphniae TaxID=1485682 RepID=A0A098VWC1_9MICR|nr:uncharacterized protein DI09_106p80 [Mitosporidium daphniae]KGG53184.1 hypothetical protein DI09_106p80 [Mitosporidium daphniae]|eukprot:XP_013239620.1 uncharacterized protein DI09_106p80 [Mitosporidium daphniae]